MIERLKSYVDGRVVLLPDDGPTSLLRLVAARAHTIHNPIREEVCSGVVPIFLPFAWLKDQLDLDLVNGNGQLIKWAKELSDEHLCEFEARGHGLTVWLRCRFKELNAQGGISESS